MSALMPTLTSVAARDVTVGDEVELNGQMVDVTANVRGNNGQRYLVTTSRDGAVLAREHDPGEVVDVWRSTDD